MFGVSFDEWVCRLFFECLLLMLSDCDFVLCLWLRCCLVQVGLLIGCFGLYLFGFGWLLLLPCFGVIVCGLLCVLWVLLGYEVYLLFCRFVALI